MAWELKEPDGLGSNKVIVITELFTDLDSEMAQVRAQGHTCACRDIHAHSTTPQTHGDTWMQKHFPTNGAISSPTHTDTKRLIHKFTHTNTHTGVRM